MVNARLRNWLGARRVRAVKLPLFATLIAIFAVTAGGIGWGIRADNEIHSAASAQLALQLQLAEQKSQVECARLLKENQSVCRATYLQERRALERGELDLAAQNTAALWGAVMGVAAVLGLGLSAGGVALVWTTFQATKKANLIAQNAFEYQVRPWLKLECETSALIFSNSDVSVRVTATCTNVGQSPANRVSVCAFILDGDWTSPRVFNAAPTYFEIPGANWQEVTVFHGEAWTRPMEVVGENIIGRANKACIVVAVRYTSPASFERMHYTSQIFDFVRRGTMETDVDFSAGPAAVQIVKRWDFDNFAA